MKIDVYNQEGEKLKEQIVLPKDVFGISVNPNLVHQIVVSQMANRRQSPAHTKDRSQVRGGGKKPWRQKGTGRARHGSTRSPIWRGGGITFGPTKEIVHKKKILKSARKKALLMVLSAKAKDNLLLVLDSLNAENPKTKKMAELFNKLPSKRESALIALPKMDNNIILSVRNITGKGTMQIKDLNCLDLLTYKYLIITKESVADLQKMFGGSDRAPQEEKDSSAKTKEKIKETPKKKKEVKAKE